MRGLVILGVGVMLWLSACATAREYKQVDAQYSLYLDVEPLDSLVTVNGEFYGSTQALTQRPLKLTAGTQRIVIEHEGYYTYRTTLEYIQPGEIYTLKTRLIADSF